MSELGAVAALQALGDRLALVAALEDVVDTTLPALEELLGHRSSLLLVHEPERDRLVTLASHGYGAGGIGSEVALGQGFIGMAASRRRPMRIGNLQRMLSYARTVQRVASPGDIAAEIMLPGLPDAGSQMAAPMIARGVLLGVLAVESADALAYGELDERVFAVAAHLVAAALEREQLAASDAEPAATARPHRTVAGVADPVAAIGLAPVRLRHYVVDGSTFLDDDYVIKGVAGRLLWKIVAEHAATGRTSFTNREAKLDPVLQLPAYRDNFESRLILLKRRLSERDAPIRLTSSGRGRFELEVSRPLVLDAVAAPTR